MRTSELTGAALDWAVAKAAGWVHADGNVHLNHWTPSTDWAQGGPIIEREKISPEWMPHSDCWMANSATDRAAYDGPTALVAAMRFYVASKLGDEVDVPDELTVR